MDIQEIYRTREKIQDHIRKTPLIRCYALEDHLQIPNRVFLKLENFQITGSFKIRGACNALLNLSNEEKIQGVICRSSGNFGYALSYLGKTLNIPVIIILSESVSLLKKQNILSQKIEIFYKKTRKEEEQLVREIAKKRRMIAFSSYDHLDVIAGGGTVALEIYDELSSLKNFICPLGGGGLMGGSSLTLKKLNSSIQTIAIEPEKGNDYFLSKKKKEKVELSQIHTIADGLKAPTVGKNNWPILEKYVDKVEIVSDKMIAKAMKFLYERVGLIVEPSAAVSVASLLHFPECLIEGDIVCVISGGNIEKKQFYKYIELD